MDVRGFVLLLSTPSHREVAGRVGETLRAEGFLVQTPEDIILPGMDWYAAVTDAMARASVILVPIPMTSAEDVDALQVARRRAVPIIPFRLPDPEESLGGYMPDWLGSIAVADLAEWDGNAGHPSFRRLVDAIGRLQSSPRSVPHDFRRLRDEERRARQRAEQQLQANLASTFVLYRVTLERTGFFAALDWTFAPRVNVLLGRNGYGKSLLFRRILALLTHADDDLGYELLGGHPAGLDVSRDGVRTWVHFDGEHFAEPDALGQIPVLAISDSRFVSRASTVIRAPEESDALRFDPSRSGAWHVLNERPYEGVLQAFLYGMCLDYFEGGRSFEGDLFETVQRIVRSLTDQSFRFDRVERTSQHAFSLFVCTEGNEEHPIEIQKASQGTMSVLVMAGLIHTFLRSTRPRTGEPPRERAGIVFIDEIDAHLHPAWQQKILPLLAREFPNVQFVVTAHSPLVVAGRKEGEVSVLRRREDGFGLYEFGEDFIGVGAEEIFAKVFRVEEHDATYDELNAMLPFRALLEDERDRIVSLPQPTDEQLRRLAEIQDRLHYLDRVERVRDARAAAEGERTMQQRVAELEDTQRTLDIQLRERVGELEKVRVELGENARRAVAYRRRWTSTFLGFGLALGLLFSMAYLWHSFEASKLAAAVRSSEQTSAELTVRLEQAGREVRDAQVELDREKSLLSECQGACLVWDDVLNLPCVMARAGPPIGETRGSEYMATTADSWVVFLHSTSTDPSANGVRSAHPTAARHTRSAPRAC